MWTRAYSAASNFFGSTPLKCISQSYKNIDDMRRGFWGSACSGAASYGKRRGAHTTTPIHWSRGGKRANIKVDTKLIEGASIPQTSTLQRTALCYRTTMLQHCRKKGNGVGVKHKGRYCSISCHEDVGGRRAPHTLTQCCSSATELNTTCLNVGRWNEILIPTLPIGIGSSSLPSSLKAPAFMPSTLCSCSP